MNRGDPTKMRAAPIADRRVEVRYFGDLNGSYTLSSRRHHETGVVHVFACRTRSISATAAAVTAPVVGEEGEIVTARFDGLGIMRGTIERHIEDGFLFSISASDEQRIKLAAKIEWLKRRSLSPASEKRQFRRQQPIDPRTAITLPDGRVLKCFLVDYSRSGAAVSADYSPEVGRHVVIGVLAARVVRHLEVGFSVRFEAVQDAEGLESLVSGFEPQIQRAEPAPAEAVPAQKARA